MALWPLTDARSHCQPTARREGAGREPSSLLPPSAHLISAELNPTRSQRAEETTDLLERPNEKEGAWMWRVRERTPSTQLLAAAIGKKLVEGAQHRV